MVPCYLAMCTCSLFLTDFKHPPRSTKQFGIYLLLHALNFMYNTPLMMKDKDSSLHALSFMLLQMMIAAL